MKVLIWFIFCLAYALLMIRLIYSGILLGLGPIPDFLLLIIFCIPAIYFCKAWDRHIIKKKIDSLFPYGLITQKTATLFQIQVRSSRKDISSKELLYFTAFNYLTSICKTEQEAKDQANIAVAAAYNCCIDALSTKVDYDSSKIHTKYVMEALTNLSLQLEIYSFLYNDKPLSSNDIQAILRRRKDFYTIVHKTCKLKKH